jgi:DNA-directed RNA polymerase subunit beta'
MLNRAPTLHRLSVQSFEPTLVEGEAIQIHPLVCTAFNADFDGDQMAVHVPLSVEAQMESRMLMLSTNNIFSPSSGRSIMTPTQDIALGIYYLTSISQKDRLRGFQKNVKVENEPRHLPLFGSINEVTLAYAESAVKLHDFIRFKNPDYQRDTVFGEGEKKLIETTVGRVFFNEIWPPTIGFVNKLVDKKMLGSLIWHCHRRSGHEKTIQVLDDLKALGFEYATVAGVSIGICDMIVPPEKPKIIEGARAQVAEVDRQYKKGVITDGERYNKIVDIWTHTTDEISNVMYRGMEENTGSAEINPVFMMVDSKARGSRQQIRQLAGMRGLMAKPSGEIIERPIVANFREGLSVLEYFISTHGARKGLADTALKTADAGYLTRKLVDVAQDVIIVERDCNTVNGIDVEIAVGDGDDDRGSLQTRILGRTTLNDIINPLTNDIIVHAGEEIDEDACEIIGKMAIEHVKVRSVLTCESRKGLCARCYGRDLATGHSADLGTAVGIIAAQSIGEPGTQLTMRTFHIGGTASSVFTQPEIIVKNGGTVRYHDLRVVKNKEGEQIVLNKNGALSLHDKTGHELERYTPAIGAAVLVDDGGKIEKGECLAKWNPYSVPILAEQEGVISSHDFVENVSVKKEIDSATGLRGTVVLESKGDLHPQIIIKRSDSAEVLGFYSIPAGAHVMVKDGQKVLPGDLLAKTPRKESKTRDITGGLPRVSELFEARQPKDAAEIAKIEGIVDFRANQRGRRCLVIRDETTGGTEEHLIPMGKHIVVFKGDRVRKGQQLTEGPIVPQEILDVCGPQELQEYLVSEIQQVYRLQGVEINDKHIELIVRQMLRKVRISNPGDTEFLWGEQVMKHKFLEVNEAAMAEGKRPAEATPALLGITKSSLETDSFISAASFQDTTRVLTDAATLGKIDYLHGFKENVIMGHLIPGGTGFQMHRNIKLVPLVDPLPEEDLAPRDEASKKLQDLLG